MDVHNVNIMTLLHLYNVFCELILFSDLNCSQSSSESITLQNKRMFLCHSYITTTDIHHVQNIKLTHNRSNALTAAQTRTRGNTHRYLQPLTRIEAYKHSLFPSTIKSWNKCTQQLVSKQSLDSFRRLLQSTPT